ncbi:lipid-transfer protein [Striga asiatica]|uniref:Lipid-transfer protein n=1 Tax=Striga asiatica TaxID=4170 RepID=A0A5A7R4F5_STRAF|nr:lipid-transfer protein [Striga asiatica]
MESAKILAILLISMLSLSSAADPILQTNCATCSPVVVPKLPVPPVTVNPKPPVTTVPKLPPANGGCPIDTLKLGACVDLLGGLVHIGPAVNKCCPILSGLVELEAAACLCTTLKLKTLNLKIYVPIALQLLVTCGKTPPPGYTCSLL